MANVGQADYLQASLFACAMLFMLPVGMIFSAENKGSI